MFVVWADDFKVTIHTHLQNIFQRINQSPRDSLVRSNHEGIERLLEENDPNLGMLMEGRSADFIKTKICELYSVGNLGERFYGLAFRKPCQGCPSRAQVLSKEILKLQESGKLFELNEKWFGDNGTCHGQVRFKTQVKDLIMGGGGG